jgi:hypothetical protein
VKRLTVIIVVVALLGGVGLLVQHGRATAFTPPNHQCPSVSTLNGVTHSYPLRISTHDVSCTEALGIVRTMVSGVGVTFVGNPEGAAAQFRWKLYGFPGWTCYGDGAGFPGHGAGGDCSRGIATVEWYHA